jgi:hypothetical protein
MSKIGATAAKIAKQTLNMTLLENVLTVAKKYIGKTEKSGNTGWKDPEFEKQMKVMGWSNTQSWCAYFSELVWKEGFTGHPMLPQLDKLFSASATATFANFSHSGNFVTGNKPKPGALVVWRHGNGWKGHIGIVSSIVDDKTFKSIEGNTNEAGSREGTAVLEKTRKLGEPYKPNGLNIIGFVYLP